MRGTIEERFHDKYIPEPNSGCWLWTAHVNWRGYGGIQNNGRNFKAHRVSWELHNGPIPLGSQVLHRCDVPSCVNPGHLFLGSHQDNMDDKVAKGRQSYKLPLGEAHGRAKLNAEQVLGIRSASGPLRVIAARFGVGLAQIGKIRSGKAWKHL